MSKPTIENLLKSLKQNKDAVIVIGEKCVSKDILKINEGTKDNYSRKKMIKNPKEFWKYYNDSIYNQDTSISSAEEAINRLINTGTIKTVINLNYTGNIKSVALLPTKIIELKGNKNIVKCMSCEKETAITNDILNSSKVVKCECGGKIAPTITMFGEKYKEKYVSEIKSSIFKEDNGTVELNTHTIIFIGVDFEEDYMHELIESFNAIKSQQGTNDHYCVMICEKDGVSIQYYQPEFATFEDIPASIDRLISNLEGYNV